MSLALTRRTRTWAGGIGLWRKIAIALAAAALASGIATYLAYTGAPPFGPRPGVVLSLLYLDLVLLLALASLVAKRLVEGWAERRPGPTRCRVQVRRARTAPSLRLNAEMLAAIRNDKEAKRGLTEAAVLDRKGAMLARTGLVFALGFEDVSKDALNRARQGEVVIMTDDREERVRALVRLDEFTDLYLYLRPFLTPPALAPPHPTPP